jgi:hypothetical protein
MPLDNTKKHVLRVARDAFAQQTGVVLKLAGDDPNNPMPNLEIPGADTELEVLVIEGGPLAVHAMLALCRKQQNIERQVVVLHQVTAEMADELRQDGVQFMDTAGNGYINQPPLYLFVKGNKAPKVSTTPATPRAFKQTGLRVLYALLCKPGLENATYRFIADKTQVALGMVNWVVKDLKELGFLIETGTGRARQLRLLEKERLLERWITAYAEQLRPKLVLGRYRGTDGWWQQATLNVDKALWGGEVAAAKLTEYLKPQVITLYVDRDDPAAVILPNRLKKDPQGDVELVACFWQLETIPPHGDMVHPILVYADLMATGNQRNMETARMIYDEHIVQLVREG